MKSVAATSITKTGTQTPIAILAPVDRPSGEAFAEAVSVAVGMIYEERLSLIKTTGLAWKVA